MSRDREVVITGLGVVCPLGIGIDSFWNSLMAGKSGVRTIESVDMSRFPIRFGGEIPDFEPKQYVKPRKSLKVMCREIQTAFASAAMAMDHAGLEKGAYPPERLGVVYGSEMIYGDIPELEDLYRNCMTEGDFDFSRFGERFPSDMFPLWLLKYLPNMSACHIGIAFDARAHNNTIALGEVSSLLSIIEAAKLIRRGHADIMLAGGSGNRLSLTGWMYRGDLLQSHRNDRPGEASRPFEADRDGMVNGEGAGTIVLESRQHAKARGAKVLATVTGYGSATNTRRGRTRYAQAAIARSIGDSMTRANVGQDSIGHVNAHGLSTIAEDTHEAQAIAAVLNDVPVTAPKSFFGNLGPGGGAVELVASVLALEHGRIPSTLNYERSDPRCPIKVVKQPMDNTRPNAVILNQSRMGQAVAIVLAGER